MNIKQLKQDKADLAATLAALKAEGWKLGATALKDRTAEQATRLTEIDGLIASANDAIAANATEIARAERYFAENTPEVIVGKNNKEDQPVSLGEVMQAMAYNGMAAHKRAQILPNGVAEHVSLSMQAAATGASSGNNESGGVLVRNEWSTALLDKVKEDAKLAPRCFDLPIGEGFDGIEAPFIDETSRATGSRWGGVQVFRAAEADTVTAKKPLLGEFKLRLEDLMALFYGTDRVLRDAKLLEALAMKAFGSEFAFKLDDEIVRGTGAGQCLGILTPTGVPTVAVPKEANQTAGTVVYENIIKMHARLLARCMPGAEWFINQALLPQLNKMYLAVGTGGVPVYLPANGLSASPYGTLMGLPVNVIEQCSAPGTKGDIILANFKNDYGMISKPMQSASSIHVRFLNNETVFRWVWPVIGKPVTASAITPYKGADSLGPFVVLADRA